jgi:hypothetical protein
MYPTNSSGVMKLKVKWGLRMATMSQNPIFKYIAVKYFETATSDE